MASIVYTHFGQGGANVAPGGGAGNPDLASVLRDIIDDITELRTQVGAAGLLAKIDSDIDKIVADLGVLRTAINGTLTKLDADGGVTDTDYSSSLAAAAMTLVAGDSDYATVHALATQNATKG